MIEIKEYILGDIAEFEYGKMPNKKHLGEGIYPTFSGYKYQYLYPEYNCEIGDIIVVARGVGGTGDVKIVSKKSYLTNLSIKISLNKDIIDNKYFYYFHSLSSLRYLDSGSAQSQITINDLQKIKISLPSLPTQTAIASILSSLDDKIELNNAINKNLEDLAQALFKHWFVDFEFPNEHGEPYKSSGGEMEESELGEIPKGWRVESFGNIVKITSGGTPSRSNPEYYEDGKILWVKSKELNNSLIFDTEEKINELGLKNSSAKIVPSYSVLIAMYGATVGQFGLIVEEATCNQAICAVIPNDIIPYSFNYLFFGNYRKDFSNMAVGSAQQNISQDLIKNIKVAVPPNILLTKFHQIVDFQLKLIEHNCREKYQLSILRDTLLPKLISGELKINEDLSQTETAT
jgi:type I restriction enzyme, S subunit